MRHPSEVSEAIVKAEAEKATTFSLFLWQLEEMPAGLSRLKHLQKLDLSYNRLKTIPPEILQLESVVELDLTGNLFTELPDGFGKLSNIKYLNLSRNAFRIFPPEVLKMTNLRFLSFGKNLLQGQVPAEISNLHNLEELHLYTNKLTELPLEIGQLENLQHLYLGNNPLHIPDEFLIRGREPQAFFEYYFGQNVD